MTDFDPDTAAFLTRAGFVPLRVTATDTVARGVLAVTLDESAPFSAGSHLEVAVPSDGEPLIRHYSLCSDSSGAQPWRIAVLKAELGRGSSWLHSTLEAPAEHPTIMVRGPRNTFPFDEASPALFIAGGIGITPLHSMVIKAEQLGLDWHLIYVGRSAELMAFAADLQHLHGPRVDVRITETQGRPDVIALANDWLNSLPAGAHPVVYTCGPEPLMNTVATGLADRDELRLEFEAFDADAQTPTPTTTPKPAPESAPEATSAGAGLALSAGVDSAHDPSNEPFIVELADGTEIPVGATETILTALNNAGIRTLSSCQKGTCGTCETDILEGAAIHRDEVLSAEEQAAQESMMICVSRCQGDRICLDI